MAFRILKITFYENTNKKKKVNAFKKDCYPFIREC